LYPAQIVSRAPLILEDLMAAQHRQIRRIGRLVIRDRGKDWIWWVV
jgi:hypothetical protein